MPRVPVAAVTDLIRRDIHTGGIQAPFWNVYAKPVEEFIHANALKPAVIEVKGLPAGIKIDLGIRGGIKPPHLHLGDKIFLLNTEQWGKFSTTIITDMKAKLAAVGEVGFEPLMKAGEFAQSLDIK